MARGYGAPRGRRVGLARVVGAPRGRRVGLARAVGAPRGRRVGLARVFGAPRGRRVEKAAGVQAITTSDNDKCMRNLGGYVYGGYTPVYGLKVSHL